MSRAMDSRLPNIAVEAGFLGEKLARRCLRRLLSIRNLMDRSDLDQKCVEASLLSRPHSLVGCLRQTNDVCRLI